MQYEVKRKVVHRGRVLGPGAKVELHPRQAKYLVVQGKLAPAGTKAKRTNVKKETGDE